MLSLSPEQVRYQRAVSQGLHDSGDDAQPRSVLGAARVCAAIQSQELMAERLTVRARTRALTDDGVRRAKHQKRSIVRSWLHRGTLHTVPSADLRWLIALLGPDMDRKALRRRADLGITDDLHQRSIANIIALLANGPHTRDQIVDAQRRAGLPDDRIQVPHILRSASKLGRICFGPDIDNRSTHVLLDDWLPAVPADQPAQPAARLAEQFFRAYGPASPSDFRYWTGLPAAKSREALSQLGSQLIELDQPNGQLILRDQLARIRQPLPDEPRVRLVGPFDPYLLGYAERNLGVSAAWHKRINAGGGMIRPAIIANGALLGVWNYRLTKTAKTAKTQITINAHLVDEPSEQLSHAIQAEADDIARFLDNSSAITTWVWGATGN